MTDTPRRASAVIIGAGIVGNSLVHHLAQLGWASIIVSIVVAFISGYASIWFLIHYLKTHTTSIFVYYRLALGTMMIVLLLAGYLT